LPKIQSPQLEHESESAPVAAKMAEKCEQVGLGRSCQAVLFYAVGVLASAASTAVSLSIGLSGGLMEAV